MNIHVSGSCLLVILALMTSGCGGNGGNTPTPSAPQEPNGPPTINSLAAAPSSVEMGASSTVTCSAADPDGDSLSYAWTTEEGPISGSGAGVTWTAPELPGLYDITVTVGDGRGGSATQTLTLVVFGGSLLVQTRDGVTAVRQQSVTGLSAFDLATNALSPRVESFILNAHNGPVEILNERIFMGAQRGITELDQQGNRVGYFGAPPEVPGLSDFTALPNMNFAYMTNHNDLIYIWNSLGQLLKTLAMPEPSSNTLQNLDGVVVDGHLVVSETGTNKLMEVDLSTFSISIFKDLSSLQGWLGAIDQRDGMYYLCQSQDIYRFTKDGEPTHLGTVTGYNITGITVLKNLAYLVTNHTGELYRFNLKTGELVSVLSGLNYPQDIEYFPVTLTAPALE